MPASIKFAAPLVRAATATLQAEMAAQVAAFNAEPANTVEIEEPATYHFGGQALLNAYAFPQCEVAAVSGKLGNFAIARATADHDLTVNAALWVQGEEGDIPTLYEQTLGLVRCAIECLTPTGAFGPGVELAQDLGVSWRCDVVPYDPTASSPAAGRSFQHWLGSGLIQFRVEPIETFQ
jgi:hypothetical protein